MDKGPWRVFPDETGRMCYVESFDFSRDVRLKVHGDFADDAERRAYCEWLAGALNDAAAKLAKSESQRLADAGFTRRDTRSQCDECGEMVGRQFLPIHECADNGTPVRHVCGLQGFDDYRGDICPACDTSVTVTGTPSSETGRRDA